MDQFASADAAGAAEVAAASANRYPIRFTGSGGEYFRIWIVNLLLTILTIGIYSAWAKVRKMQYFYRNTQLDGSVFDYHGNPLSILKGRLIALALILFYNFGFDLNPVVGVIAAVVFGTALPWLLVQSQRFKLHNTSYRGLRFRFDGPVSEAYVIFGIPLGIALAAGVMLGLSVEQEEPNVAIFWAFGAVYLVLMVAMPYLHWRLKRYQHNNARYGQARGHFHAKVGPFYWIYGQAFLMVIGVIALGFGLVTLLRPGPGEGGGAAAVVVFAIVVLLYFVILGLTPFVMARVQNLVWNNSLLGLIGFDSAIKARRFVWIAVTNLLLILVTLGLYTPFAAVRMYRYRVESVTVLSTSDLAGVAAAQAQEVGTTGEGAADLLDIDFAL